MESWTFIERSTNHMRLDPKMYLEERATSLEQSLSVHGNHAGSTRCQKEKSSRGEENIYTEPSAGSFPVHPSLLLLSQVAGRPVIEHFLP